MCPNGLKYPKSSRKIHYLGKTMRTMGIWDFRWQHCLCALRQWEKIWGNFFLRQWFFVFAFQETSLKSLAFTQDSFEFLIGFLVYDMFWNTLDYFRSWFFSFFFLSYFHYKLTAISDALTTKTSYTSHQLYFRTWMVHIFFVIVVKIEPITW